MATTDEASHAVYETQWHRVLLAGVREIDWRQLPEQVRASHAVFGRHTFLGRAAVTRGCGLLAGLVAGVFGLPSTVDDVEIEVIKTRRDLGEHWQRRFGDQNFHSALSLKDGRVVERFGPLAFELDLRVVDGALWYPLRRGWLFGIPLPRLLLPESRSREFMDKGRFNFDIAIYAPLGIGLLVHYRGWLVPLDEGPTSSATVG